PHITDEIKRRMTLLGDTAYDIIITELGGTVGDIESLPYLEALRQLRMELGHKNAVSVHLTLIPYLSAAQELKTKPTQHSVKELLETGIQPDILVCRTEKAISDEIRVKLALFCNVKKNCVIEAIDASSIYDVPILMQEEKLDIRVLEKLGLKSQKKPELKKWKIFLEHLKKPKHEVKIGLIGKYNELPDAYKSIYESFVHSGAANYTKVRVVAIHSEDLEEKKSYKTHLEGLDGLLIAPGFGERGIQGKINAIQYAREKKIPFFGICLGMQCASVEFARNVLKIKDASSTEVNPNTKNPIIDMLPEQRKIKIKGGTMRLGAYPCQLKENTIAFKAYHKKYIAERHRHRYEFNNKYIKLFEKNGMVISGINPDRNLVEIIELKDHPWFVGVQFHPELKSTVEKPHPLFVDFVKACVQNKK
ncbi:MAG: CTP synthase, partial [Saprospiraceae bacterium]